MNKTIIWIIVIIAVLALGAVLLRGNKAKETGEYGIDNTDSSETARYIVGDNALSIDDQPADANVTASMAVFEAPGFVVVHERGANGQVGAVLGASALLPAGQSNNVPVPLKSSLVAGKTYIAMLHLDNGDGVASELTDPAARDANGGEILMEFLATGTGVNAGASTNL